MFVTITTDGEDIYNLEIDSQMAIEDLKALLEAESGVPPDMQRLFYHGKELSELKKTLEEYQVGQNEMIHMQRIQQAAPSHPDFDAMRQHVLQDQRLLQQLERTNPELAHAARYDPAKFSTMVEQIEQSRCAAEIQKAQLAALNNDPFDIEAQKRIEEAIRQENIAANLEAAMEYNPESFTRVTRLYINVEINNKKLVALVDSGAQSTVISPETAEACGLMRLLDTRFSGVAKGVGTAKILGRIHSAQMRLSKNFFLTCSFIVLEGKGSELLFGLDMLKKHRACIDLRKNALTFDDCDIPFLAEHELPEKQRRIEIHGSEDEIPPADPKVAIPAAAEAAGASSAGGSSSSSNTQSKFSEKDIKLLTDMGVSRQEAIQALEMAGGNPDLAASLLF
ncbi:DNA damage-inducible protein 1 [Rhizopus azygosporus]|uniref:DNA damage-inducible protein 1 n=1 Tax=Rhizopus azygosporus TaxID=86630 RepID=A0A367J5P1_RHIAZ|nr:DNA damage-inducible protein 1 [Rhizopus azygosporus]